MPGHCPAAWAELRPGRGGADLLVFTDEVHERIDEGQVGEGLREVPEVPGVDPGHATETFAEVQLALDNWRWPGTVFRLRTGKALAQDRKEVAVRFRPVPHLPFPDGGQAAPNVLRFHLDPEGLTLSMTGVGAHAGTLAPLVLAAQTHPPGLPAYGQLLGDVLHRNSALSIRGDEAEESWRVVTPVLEAWSDGLVPMETYPAGSAGPPQRHA